MQQIKPSTINYSVYTQLHSTDRGDKKYKRKGKGARCLSGANCSVIGNGLRGI